MKKRMCRLNEELLRVNGLEEKEKLVKEPVEAVDPTYNDAINSHKKIKDNLEDVFKEQEKEKEKFIKENEKTELKVKGTKEMKKLKLSESLFEDYNDDPNTYQDIFNVLDNIQHLVSSTMEWSDEEWTVDNTKQTRDMLHDEINRLTELVHILDRRNDEKALGEAAVLDKPTELTYTETDDEDDIYYKKKRQPLADIIMRDLTSGEVVYRLKDGKYSPTHRPSLNIDEYDVGANSDEHGEYILARVETEPELDGIKAIADRYGKEFKTEFDKWAVGPKYVGKIYIDYEDWDKPYFDPDVKVRVK